MKKYLMNIDLTTKQAFKVVTITLGADNKVTLEPQNAVIFHSQLLGVVLGGKAIRCQAGKPYFDALDTLRGSLFYVTSEDKKTVYVASKEWQNERDATVRAPVGRR